MQDNTQLTTGRQQAEAPPAVQLFEERARRADARFAVTGENLEQVMGVISWVGGNPLAIELAASGVRHRTVADISGRLRDSYKRLQTRLRNVPKRHRSMETVLRDSWELLDAKEQESLSRLSLFRSGFSAAAALAVVSADEYLLDRLVDRSLLQRWGSGRYGMHEVLRQFSAEHLHADEALYQNAEARFATYYIELLASWRIEMHDEELVQLLQREVEHIRMTWHWLLENDSRSDFLRLLRPMHSLYNIRFRFREGRTLFAAALDRFQLPTTKESLEASPALSPLDSEITAGLLIGYADFCKRLGESEHAYERISLGIDVARTYQHMTWLSEAQAILVLVMEGTHLERHREMIESAIQLNKEIGNYFWVGQMLYLLFYNARLRGARKEARHTLGQLRLLLDEQGFTLGAPFVHFSEGWLQLDEGDIEEAHDNFERTMLMLAQYGMFEMVEYNARLGLGVTKWLMGDHHSAEALFTEAEQLAQTGDTAIHHIQTHIMVARTALMNNDRHKARHHLNTASTHAQRTAHREFVAEIQTLLGFAHLLAGRPKRACEQWQIAAELADSIGARPQYDMAMALLKGANPSSKQSITYLDQLLVEKFRVLSCQRS